MTLLTQIYIREHGLESLISKFSLKSRRHSIYDNLVLLKYSQIDSPTSHPIVRECRGLILDETNDWAVVAFPYRRFANYGEGWADDVDMSTAKIYEKLDGSIVTMYFYDEQWNISTSGVPDASGDLSCISGTFADLFWKVWRELNYSLPHDDDRGKCFMFELMTPFNRVVVRHPENRIALHGARRLSDFKELNPKIEAHLNNWECVKTFPLTSFEALKNAVSFLDPMVSEGYVVCDSNYNRVKIKSLAYVAVAHMKDAFSTRRLLEIIRTNESSEFLIYYPEYLDLYWEIRVKYEYLMGEMQGYYDAICNIEERKAFALMATKKEYSAGLFGVKFGKNDSFKSYLANINIRTLEGWLEIKLISL